jgi:hypothetical protein
MGSSVAAECISAVGNISGTVASTYDLNCPEPITNGPVTADPYKSRATPSAASCTSNHTLAQFPAQGSGTMRCYSGSANVSVNNHTLASNTTYVFTNTGTTKRTWRVNANRTVSGTNVTLIFVGNWDVQANGNSKLNITAPTTGTYKGIALFGDRNSDVDIDVSGTNVGKVVGAIYSPNKNSHIKYTGNSTAYSAGQCTQVIGGTVEFTGNSTFNTNCSASGTTAIMAGQSIRIVG